MALIMNGPAAGNPEAELPTLEGKRCVVTGATSGIGLSLAAMLAARGSEVVGVGRSRERCREAVERVRGEAPGARISYECADLSSQEQVRGLAARLASGGDKIDVLVNNAGTFSLTRVITADGIELQLAVNYLAAFLLSTLLLPSMASGGRIINVSSGSHVGARIRFGNIGLRPIYNGLSAYGQSKLAIVLFTRELARRLGPQAPVSVYAADPGLVDTAIGTKGTGPLVAAFWRLRARAGVAPRESAAWLAYLASAPEVATPSGEYWHQGRLTASSPRSRDPHAASRLWDLSERLCGEHFAAPMRMQSAPPARAGFSSGRTRPEAAG
ncbi:MAG TPA: SDR family NAD(P)-dependent oxidoreductase [Spirochaetia bacterium]|nr:SDR family NAD(P)-dependent oxidoreductase [Spirochaetia bacterium]